MKFKNLYLRNVVFLLFLIALFSSVLLGQTRPDTVNLNANNDDDNLCGFQSENNKFDGTGQLANTQFCRLYRVYTENKNGDKVGQRIARDARNEMINLVIGQVDSYYKFRKADRRTKIRWFQTILDFLQIGGATAIAIMNGERAKTIVGAAIAGIQGGSTQFNKNFEILQTQALINKMNTKRANIKIEIIGNMDRPITAERYTDSYSWYAAKNDLRRYLIAGTFDDALDTLVKESGAEADLAERALRRVEKRTIQREASRNQVQSTFDAQEVLIKIEDALAGTDEEKEKAAKALRIILADLNNTPAFEGFFSDKGISSQSTGKEIYDAIRDLMSDRANADDDAASDLIEEAIKKNGGIN